MDLGCVTLEYVFRMWVGSIPLEDITVARFCDTFHFGTNGTLIPILSVISLEDCLDWVFYEELPNLDAGDPIHDGEIGGIVRARHGLA